MRPPGGESSGGRFFCRFLDDALKGLIGKGGGRLVKWDEYGDCCAICQSAAKLLIICVFSISVVFVVFIRYVIEGVEVLESHTFQFF